MCLTSSQVTLRQYKLDDADIWPILQAKEANERLTWQDQDISKNSQELKTHGAQCNFLQLNGCVLQRTWELGDGSVTPEDCTKEERI